MNVDNLVLMANRIGEFFDAMPDRPEALAGISNHIRKFWAVRMRAQLTAYWTTDGGTGLRPIVLEALRTHPVMPTAAPVEAEDPGHAAERQKFDGASEA